MGVAFRLPSERPLDLVGFAWSPLFEAVLSLQVVVHPKRAPMHLPWARRCRELPTDLLDEIHVLGGPIGPFIPGIFEVGLSLDRPSFTAELDALLALDEDLVAFELSHALAGPTCVHEPDCSPEQVHDPAYRALVLEGASRHEGRAELAQQVFADPAAVLQRFAHMLERYWEHAFHDEWDRIVPRIESEVTVGARALVTGGAGSLVAELLPEGTWEPETRSIHIDKVWEGECDVAARGGMLFVPTVYGWPCVLVELAQPWPVSIIFPLRDLRQPEVPTASDHEVATGLRALGDETRLQIARMIAEQPRSTKELAELLRLSDSAVSRHLKVLESAGVIQGERDGYFVLYRLQPDRIGELGGALRRTLGIAPGAGSAIPSLPVSLSRPPQLASVQS